MSKQQSKNISIQLFLLNHWAIHNYKKSICGLSAVHSLSFESLKKLLVRDVAILILVLVKKNLVDHFDQLLVTHTRWHWWWRCWIRGVIRLGLLCVSVFYISEYKLYRTSNVNTVNTIWMRWVIMTWNIHLLPIRVVTFIKISNQPYLRIWHQKLKVMIILIQNVL